MKLSTNLLLERERHGGKASGLQQILRAGGRIPPTFVLEAGTAPSTDLSVWLDQQDASEFLVRSSAPAEDGSEHSGAGAYLSLRVPLYLVPESISRVTLHGETLSGRPIAVLIQPALDGPGGVYLGSPLAGAESLRMALSGPVGITSGTALPPDLLMADSPEAIIAWRECRALAATLGGAVDLEFVIVNGSIVWLQYRPLVAHMMEPPVGLSEHFPSTLPLLCGSLWVDVLRREYGEGIEFDGGYIVGLTDGDDDKEFSETVEPSESELCSAERHYHYVLFPRWQSLWDGLRTTRSEPIDGLLRAIDAWRSFWHEYLSNPYEDIVRRARRAAGAGAGVSPSVREHMHRLYSARSELSETDINTGCISPAVASYVEDYGYLPLSGNDFSQPTLREMPEVCLRQISAANKPPEKKGTDSLLHRVAWLTEEDNFYKWRLAAQLRYSIIGLGEFLRVRGICSSADAIWRVHLEDLLDWTNAPDLPLFSRAEDKTPKVRPTRWRTPTPVQHPNSRIYSAAVLAPGAANARASRTNSFHPGDVLFSVALDASDYGLLATAAAAVVALGGIDSHVALFAREIGIPLFRCPEAVRTMRPRERVLLGDMPPTVTFIAE